MTVREKFCDPTQGVFVNPELRENYGLKVGDTLELRVKGKQHQIKIAGFAENADLKTIYIPKDQAFKLWWLKRMIVLMAD